MVVVLCLSSVDFHIHYLVWDEGDRVPCYSQFTDKDAEACGSPVTNVKVFMGQRRARRDRATKQG